MGEIRRLRARGDTAGLSRSLYYLDHGLLVHQLRAMAPSGGSLKLGEMGLQRLADFDHRYFLPT